MLSCNHQQEQVHKCPESISLSATRPNHTNTNGAFCNAHGMQPVEDETVRISDNGLGHMLTRQSQSYADSSCAGCDKPVNCASRTCTPGVSVKNAECRFSLANHGNKSQTESSSTREVHKHHRHFKSSRYRERYIRRYSNDQRERKDCAQGQGSNKFSTLWGTNSSYHNKPADHSRKSAHYSCSRYSQNCSKECSDSDCRMSSRHINSYSHHRGKISSLHHQKGDDMQISGRNIPPACSKERIKNEKVDNKKRIGDDAMRERDFEVAQRSTVNGSGEHSVSSDLNMPGSSSVSSDIYNDPEKMRLQHARYASSGCEIVINSDHFTRRGGGAEQKDTEISPEAMQRQPSTLPQMSSRNHSVTRLLLKGYQRGEVGKNTVYKTMVLSTASSLRHTGSWCVFTVPQVYENVEHMTHMEVNKDHDKLLCMWSISGTGMQQVQLVNVRQRTRTQCGELPVEFVLSEAVLQSWRQMTSLCLIEHPWYSHKDSVLYTTNDHSNLTSVSVAHLRALNPAVGDTYISDFQLGNETAWSCAWNACKEQFCAGLDKGSKVVDINTRDCWWLNTNGGDVLTQVFSKADGGNSLFCGTSSGLILMHDLRRESKKPIKLMSHRKSICDLKLSADEHHVYTRDIVGQIKKWDLRMCKVVSLWFQIKKWDLRMCKATIKYEGLCSKNFRLPFHIDDTQSILYAAGSDCHTKIWCLQSGQLLHSIPPPYEASHYAVPTVQFSSKWAGVPGNMGLIMGAHKNLHLYSSEF